MQRISVTMSHALGTLDSQAGVLTTLSEQKEKDSKTIKALTSVATIYLPISLVVALFNSSLIQLLPDDSLKRPSHFVAASQAWLPAIVAASLTILTLAFAWLLGKSFKHTR